MNKYVKLIVSVIYYTLINLKYLYYYIIKKDLSHKITVLLYHSLHPNNIPLFKKQMVYILNNSNVLDSNYDTPLKNGRNYIILTFDDGFKSFYDYAMPVLADLNIPVTVFIPSDYIGLSPRWVMSVKYGNPNEVMMTEEQIKMAATKNVVIGSHSKTHPRLPELNRQLAFKELLESKLRLESITQTNVSQFSFPYGEYNSDLVELCKEAGYERIYLASPKDKGENLPDYVMGRITISFDESFLEFRLKCFGAYEWLPIAIKIKSNIIKKLNRMYIIKRKN